MPAVRGHAPEPCHRFTGQACTGYRDALAGLAPGPVLAMGGPVAVDKAPVR
ncbi:hypothetical protein ACWGKQ_32110 [Streptomyces sp. NPDC054770]